MLTPLQLQFLNGQPGIEADLQQKASTAGFDLQIASGFRNFERQLTIWNNKACGVTPILDSDCQPLERNNLSDDGR